MGTNFYWKDLPPELEKIRTPDNEEILLHLGKRGGAGMYCRDCGITFCKGGTVAIHTSDYDWYDKCPLCGGEGDYVTSFLWTFRKQIDLLLKYSLTHKVVDEYGDEYTINNFFAEELKNCVTIDQCFAEFY